MLTAPSTPSDLRPFEDALRERRQEVTGEAGRVADTFAAVHGARSDGATDGAHDAEASAMRTEWSRLSRFQGEFAAELTAIDAALGRIIDGTYGLCTRRGEVIGRARLEARPASELCIDCAQQLESRRRR